MKKATAIFLFLCLTAPYPFSYFWIQGARNEIRKEMKRKIIQGLDEKSLVMLSFSETEASQKIHWKESWEFEYNQQMYDVVTSKSMNDSIVFHCYRDHRETTLNQQVKALVAKALGHHPQNRENQKRMTTLFTTLYLSATFLWNPWTNDGSRLDFKYTTVSAKPGFFKPPVPPPRRCLSFVLI